MVSVATTAYNKKAAIDDIEMKECGCVSVKHYKNTGGRIDLA